MKKIWKNLCACSLALACSGGLVACGGEEEAVSRDLDGDGVIASWETLYEDMEHSVNKTLTGEITYISNADELLDINNHVDEQKIYALRSNIDLGGREVSINLGKSEFYGFNFVISNFKLETLNGAKIGETGFDNTYIKALFRNGTGVFSTRIFMGSQSINVDSSAGTSEYYISSFFNVPVISDVDVKGQIKVNGKGVDNRTSAKVNASLLYTGMPTVMVTQDESEVVVEDVTCIDNINIDGEMHINNDRGSRISVNAGSIASVISKYSMIYNCYAQAKIYTTSSEDSSAISGIVGYNKGFVSTCTFTGEIALTNNDNLNVLFQNDSYYSDINIGAIAGVNDTLAEIKNCSTNAQINLSAKESEPASVSTEYAVGGIVGSNQNGILELCQSDAVISLSKLNNVVVGAIAGVSQEGIISYNICRGSITGTSISNISVAQAVGLAENGLLEKLMITTPINIDNSNRMVSRLKVGMVTVFEDYESSPYFRRIMVDGITNVVTMESDNSKFDYKQGLRYPYQVQVGQDNDGGDSVPIMDTIVPDVFENLFRSDGCKLYKYSQVANNRTEDNVTVNYANNLVGVSTGTTRWMIDYMDFKNYLNHNEVSLDANLNLSTLHFTISDVSTRLQSFFGGGKYNGELAFFDREFTKSYNHSSNSLGACEHDQEDEMLSFVYDLIKSNNGRGKELYAIKVNSSYIDRAPDNVDDIDYLSADANIFVEKLCNALGCLGIYIDPHYIGDKKDGAYVTRLDESGNDLEQLGGDEGGSGNQKAKYILINFSDASSNYSMKIDISNMQETPRVTEDAKEAFVLFMTFTISSKIV